MSGLLIISAGFVDENLDWILLSIVGPEGLGLALRDIWKKELTKRNSTLIYLSVVSTPVLPPL